MKYKPGDKVIIKAEYRCNMLCNNNNGVIEITAIKKLGGKEYYYSKKNNWGFFDEHIECLLEGYRPPVPITSRFDILDIRD